MVRSKFIRALALLVTITCLRAHAAAPSLPPGSIAADTIVVVHVEGSGISPDAMKTAAQTILGANAKVADEQIAKFKEKYDKAIAAGALSLTMIAGDEKKDPEGKAGKTPAALYIKLKAGADSKALEEMITADMKADEKAKMVFEEKDGYLVMHEKESPLPSKADDALTQSFTDALGTISEAAVQIAFVPNARLKAEILKGAQNEAPVKGIKDAGPVIANSKWMTVSISLGNAPGISLSAHTADGPAAKTLSDAINASIDDAKAQAANPNGGPMGMFGPLIAPMLEGLRPTTNGSQVSIALKGQTLVSIGNFAAQMGVFGGGPK